MSSGSMSPDVSLESYEIAVTNLDIGRCCMPEGPATGEGTGGGGGLG